MAVSRPGHSAAQFDGMVGVDPPEQIRREHDVTETRQPLGDRSDVDVHPEDLVEQHDAGALAARWKGQQPGERLTVVGSDRLGSRVGSHGPRI